MSKTKLELLTLGKVGGEFEAWGRATVYSTPPGQMTLRWSTDEAGAAAGEWTVATKNEKGQAVVVAGGKIDTAPKPGEKAHFDVPASFFTPQPPSPPKVYYLRMQALDGASQPLGNSSLSVVITHGPNESTPLTFADDLGGQPAAYVEPGHPSVKFLHYDPLTETVPGGLRIEVHNPTAKPTDAVQIRMADLKMVARQKEGLINVPALAPGAKQTVSFTLLPLITKGALTLEEDWQKWRDRYSNGVSLLAGTNKIGSAYVQYAQPPYSGATDVGSCGNRKHDGDEAGFDCGGTCGGPCIDCFTDDTPGDGDAAEYYSNGNPAVVAAALGAKLEYLNYFNTKYKQKQTLDYFDKDKVGKDRAAHRIILAVARYVDKNMTYFQDDFDSWGRASAAKTIIESGNRTGTSGNKVAGGLLKVEKCPNLYCGDCEDHAYLRASLLRSNGIGRSCAWIAEHHNSLDQGQDSCTQVSKKDGSGGHVYNLVYWKGKYRILDYSSVPVVYKSTACWDQHATDNVYDDVYGDEWSSPLSYLAPRGKIHHNIPTIGTCGGSQWNWKTYYTDVCP